LGSIGSNIDGRLPRVCNDIRRSIRERKKRRLNFLIVHYDLIIPVFGEVELFDGILARGDDDD